MNQNDPYVCNISPSLIAPKLQPLIWYKPPIWNTFAADRVVFHIGGFTQICTVDMYLCNKYADCTLCAETLCI